MTFDMILSSVEVSNVEWLLAFFVCLFVAFIYLSVYLFSIIFYWLLVSSGFSNMFLLALVFSVSFVHFFWLPMFSVAF